MIKIIGYTGFAQSGKDTACGFAEEWLAGRAVKVTRYALADPLKKCVNKMFGWGEEHAFGHLKEQEVEVVTHLEDMITALDWLFSEHATTLACPLALATKWWNILDANCNVNIHFGIHFTSYRLKISPRKAYQLFGTELIRNCVSDTFWFELAEHFQAKMGGVIQIPDIRFENEVQWIIGRGDALLVGIDNPNRKDIGQLHSSEQYIPHAISRSDVTIHNTGTLDDLRKSIHYCLGRLYK